MPTVIPSSQMEKVARTFSYFLLGTAGVLVLIFPPMSIEREIGLLTPVWGACMIVSYLAAISAFTRRYRLEYVALPLTIVGAVIYAATVWVIVPGTITRIPQAVILTSMSAMLITRFFALHHLVNSWKGKSWTGL